MTPSWDTGRRYQWWIVTGTKIPNGCFIVRCRWTFNFDLYDVGRSINLRFILYFPVRAESPYGNPSVESFQRARKTEAFTNIVFQLNPSTHSMTLDLGWRFLFPMTLVSLH
jgi:hypothetical protein